MDVDKLEMISTLIGEIIDDDNFPTLEELDYDEEALSIMGL